MARINAKATTTTFGTAGGDFVVAQYLQGDTIDGLGGNDVIIGLNGDDKLMGGAGNDLLIGNGGIDDLQGGDGRDRLSGGDGDDLLWGGEGADILTGGRGADEFHFKTVTESSFGSVDVITDYNRAAGDRIYLDFMTFAVNVGATQFIGSQEFRGIGFNIPEIRAVKVGGGNFLVEVDKNGDTAADMQLIVHSNAALSFDDFWF
jgi:Ca2+-binding RTX toxin-like protein